jgi:phosphoglycolate phosphatase
MLPYECVIFDLDGTLLNTLEDLADAVNFVLRRHGFPVHPPEAYKTFIGDGPEKLVVRALPVDNRRQEVLEVCIAEFLRAYGKNWKKKTRPFEGIPEMLDALVFRQLKMAVLSNKVHAFTKKCVGELLSNWTFQVVHGLKKGVPGKPDPQGALAVAKYLGCPPKKCLYLGDSAVDMQTARWAEMFAVGAVWGFRSREELEGAGAHALIETPMEILQLIDAS